MYGQAVAATPPGSPALPGFLNNLRTCRSDRYARTGRFEDLQEAIRVYEQAVAATPPGSPDLPGYLNNLGTGLSDRYARPGRFEDLQEAIRVYEPAVAAPPPGSVGCGGAYLDPRIDCGDTIKRREPRHLAAGPWAVNLVHRQRPRRITTAD